MRSLGLGERGGGGLTGIDIPIARDLLHEDHDIVGIACISWDSEVGGSIGLTRAQSHDVGVIGACYARGLAFNLSIESLRLRVRGSVVGEEVANSARPCCCDAFVVEGSGVAEIVDRVVTFDSKREGH